MPSSCTSVPSGIFPRKFLTYESQIIDSGSTIASGGDAKEN